MHDCLVRETAENELARLMELAAALKIIVSAHIALDFPGIGSIAVHVDGLSWSPPAWPKRAGLVVVKHRDRRGADPEDEYDGQQANP